MSGDLTSWVDRFLSQPIRHLLETPPRLLKGYVAPGMTVMDVGSGKGYYSLGMARLAGENGRVVSVDTRADAIAALKEKAERAGIANRIDTRLCHERDLGVGDLSEQIDFALAVYVVHHAADVVTLLKNVHAALKPGGKLLIIEPRHHASAAEREATEKTAQAAGFRKSRYPRLKRDWAVEFIKS